MKLEISARNLHFRDPPAPSSLIAATVRFWPWRVDRRGLPDGYSGTSLATGLGLARVFEAAALSLPALAAALAVVAGLAGLEGVDLAAVDLVDDARLGGMALKSFLLYEHPEQSSAWGTLCAIQTELMCVFLCIKKRISPGRGADSNAFLLYEN